MENAGSYVQRLGSQRYSISFAISFPEAHTQQGVNFPAVDIVCNAGLPGNGAEDDQ